MANTNTDHIRRAADIAPVTNPTAGTATAFQRSAAVAQQVGAGIARVAIPGQYKALANKLKVRVYGNSKLATNAGQTVTVTLNAINTAGTSVIVASTGAVAAATQGGNTAGWYLELEVLLDPAVINTQAGEFQGNYSNTLVARAGILAALGFTRTIVPGTSATQGLDENQFFGVSVTQAVADATAVHTVVQFTTEIL